MASKGGTAKSQKSITNGLAFVVRCTPVFKKRVVKCAKAYSRKGRRPSGDASPVAA